MSSFQVTFIPRTPVWIRVALVSACLCWNIFGAENHRPEALFDAANKAFEQRQFAEAARGYEQVLSSGARFANVYVNLGTAYYKAGDFGRAIAAFRSAESLIPRDSELRANLSLAREKVDAMAAPSGVTVWRSIVRFLTINEWTVLSLVGWTIFFALLAWREWKKGRSNSWPWAASLLLLLIFSGTIGAWTDRVHQTHAVVIAARTNARFGPLVESQVAFELPGGSEVLVRDRKNEWVQIQTFRGRLGWLPAEHLIVLGAERSGPAAIAPLTR